MLIQYSFQEPMSTEFTTKPTTMLSVSSPSSASSSRNLQEPLPPPPPPPSAAFFCPVCNLLMADPVLTPTGRTLHDSCLQACRELNFTPPHLPLNLPPSLDDPYPFIYNHSLERAILGWCSLSGHPPPISIPYDNALCFVRILMSMATPPPPLPPPLPLDIDLDREEKILNQLRPNNRFVRTFTLRSLILTPFFSWRILGTLIPFLQDSNFRTPTTKLIYKFSLNPLNRTHIIHCGAILPLISMFVTGNRKAMKRSAGALCNLVKDERNCLAVSAFGAIPLLLEKFFGHYLSKDVQREAALALCKLSEFCQENCRILSESGLVQRLMGAARDKRSPREMRRYALMLLRNLVEGSQRGREEVMQIVGSDGLLGMLRVGKGVGSASLAVMYGVCRGDLEWFRDVGFIRRLEDVLTNEEEEWGDEGKQMARAMVSVIRGEIKEREHLDERVTPRVQTVVEEHQG